MALPGLVGRKLGLSHVDDPAQSLASFAHPTPDPSWHRVAEPADIAAVAWRRTKRIALPEPAEPLGVGQEGVFMVECAGGELLVTGPGLFPGISLPAYSR